MLLLRAFPLNLNNGHEQVIKHISDSLWTRYGYFDWQFLNAKRENLVDRFCFVILECDTERQPLRFFRHTQ